MLPVVGRGSLSFLQPPWGVEEGLSKVICKRQQNAPSLPREGLASHQPQEEAAVVAAHDSMVAQMRVEAPASMGRRCTEQGLGEAGFCLQLHH